MTQHTLLLANAHKSKVAEVNEQRPRIRYNVRACTVEISPARKWHDTFILFNAYKPQYPSMRRVRSILNVTFICFVCSISRQIYVTRWWHRLPTRLHRNHSICALTSCSSGLSLQRNRFVRSPDKVFAI